MIKFYSHKINNYFWYIVFRKTLLLIYHKFYTVVQIKPNTGFQNLKT